MHYLVNGDLWKRRGKKIKVNKIKLSLDDMRVKKKMKEFNFGVKLNYPFKD